MADPSDERKTSDSNPYPKSPFPEQHQESPGLET